MKAKDIAQEVGILVVKVIFLSFLAGGAALALAAPLLALRGLR